MAKSACILQRWLRADGRDCFVNEHISSLQLEDDQQNIRLAMERCESKGDDESG